MSGITTEFDEEAESAIENAPKALKRDLFDFVVPFCFPFFAFFFQRGTDGGMTPMGGWKSQFFKILFWPKSRPQGSFWDENERNYHRI